MVTTKAIEAAIDRSLTNSVMEKFVHALATAEVESYLEAHPEAVEELEALSGADAGGSGGHAKSMTLLGLKSTASGGKPCMFTEAGPGSSTILYAARGNSIIFKGLLSARPTDDTGRGLIGSVPVDNQLTHDDLGRSVLIAGKAYKVGGYGGMADVRMAAAGDYVVPPYVPDATRRLSADAAAAKPPALCPFCQQRDNVTTITDPKGEYFHCTNCGRDFAKREAGR